MRFGNRSACIMLLLAALGAVAAAAPQGEVRRVSVLSLPVKSAPDGLSSSVATLKYGDPVTVLSAVVANAAAPVQDTGGSAAKSGKNGKAAAAVPTPRWFRVKTVQGDGYVPEGATVGDAQFNAQTAPGRQPADTTGAGRGFSESEDPDLAAVKGAGGSAETGNADFAQLDKLMAAQPVEDEQAKNRDFRQTGKLGEYKQAGVQR